MYQGNVASGLGGSVASAGATTNVPASYQVGAGNDMAQSVTQSMAGGTVRAKARSEFLIAAAATRIGYSVHLDGPDGPAVPVRVIASGFADGSGIYAKSSAYFTLDALTPLFGSVSHSYGQPLQSFAIDQVIKLAPNTDYIVGLLAMASAGSPFEHDVNFAEAFVDPQFIVDPAFASMYTVVGLPDIAAVPEPAEWMLLLLGGAVLVGARPRMQPHQKPMAQRHTGAGRAYLSRPAAFAADSIES